MSFLEALQERTFPFFREQALFRSLLEPKTPSEMEAMAQRAHDRTVQHYGKTVRLFAPLYLSNECVNVCRYCGFSRSNPILRVTLSPEEVEREARYLAEQGFRSILLVAGEHPKWVSPAYVAACIRRIRPYFPSISIEIAPLETDEYRRIVDSGAEGVVVYQETYDPQAYASLHLSGPKRDFGWRLQAPERAYRAGFRRIGIGALLGLAPWREDAFALAAHAAWLLKHAWRSYLTISLPRLRPAAGGFVPEYPVSDREFVQLHCAFRILFPQVGLVLSTRESPLLRDRLIPLGITLLSAGSRTDPGGYTGAGRERLHRTVAGRSEPPTPVEAADAAEEQFATSDERSPRAIADRLREIGYEPVWKDWEECLTNAAST
ncbi:thiamin biosynthesis ThiGH complex subunit [Methylacidimicrobium sp. AP8]|uniref:2-iminoacetate synthase ThiH n=1 Tax=Methylacidimicrobium sp. AP8 TaxID=2730359 RepID=UPI0018C1A5B8|nr:2-iminoacetate synthase ThiH [Methylacidimicrobium sp. AP8]CAB4242645.1 thiamin biosynthesis ThiGH complex subunit [Methylacidimicrobium sp. AP8]